MSEPEKEVVKVVFDEINERSELMKGGINNSDTDLDQKEPIITKVRIGFKEWVKNFLCGVFRRMIHWKSIITFLIMFVCVIVFAGVITLIAFLYTDVRLDPGLFSMIVDKGAHFQHILYNPYTKLEVSSLAFTLPQRRISHTTNAINIDLRSSDIDNTHNQNTVYFLKQQEVYSIHTVNQAVTTIFSNPQIRVLSIKLFNGILYGITQKSTGPYQLYSLFDTKFLLSFDTAYLPEGTEFEMVKMSVNQHNTTMTVIFVSKEEVGVVIPKQYVFQVDLIKNVIMRHFDFNKKEKVIHIDYDPFNKILYGLTSTKVVHGYMNKIYDLHWNYTYSQFDWFELKDVTTEDHYELEPAGCSFLFMDRISGMNYTINYRITNLLYKTSRTLISYSNKDHFKVLTDGNVFADDVVALNLDPNHQ